MTDLSSLDAIVKNQEEGVELKVKHPVTNEPLGITLRVLGYESATVRKVQRKQVNQRLKNQRKRVTAEEIETNGREVQAAAIAGWSFDDGVTLDGVVPEFTPENVDRVLRRFPFIAAQVDDLAADASAFLES